MAYIFFLNLLKNFVNRKAHYDSLHFTSDSCSISLKKPQTKYKDFINLSKSLQIFYH